MSKIEQIGIITSDGVNLDADLSTPTSSPPRACIAIAHPHPQYGGDRFNNVVEGLFKASQQAGYACIRYDFRGVGLSTGQFANGEGEKNDQKAALKYLADAFPGVPLISAGYSFGSLVALGSDYPGVVAFIGVAPPIREGVARPLAADDARPTLLLSPEEDQFAPAASLPAKVGDWKNTQIVEIPGADHFMAGRTAWVGEKAVKFIEDVIGK